MMEELTSVQLMVAHIKTDILGETYHSDGEQAIHKCETCGLEVSVTG